MEDIERLRRVLISTLRSAGEILRRDFGRTRIHYKGKANLITGADRASEKHILGKILKNFPNHDFMAEESSPKSSGSEYIWIIDPLDGTTNYAHGYPTACVNIGLVRQGRPLLGGTYDPFRDELFFAERGRGAFLNEKRIRVSGITTIAKALLVTGFPYDRIKNSKFYVEFYRQFMVQSHDVRRSGSAALDMAWVAAGRAEGFWEFNLHPWDVTAGLLLIQEAGGKVTDFSGQAWTSPQMFGKETLATNAKIHQDMLRMFIRHPRAGGPPLASLASGGGPS